MAIWRLSPRRVLLVAGYWEPPEGPADDSLSKVLGPTFQEPVKGQQPMAPGARSLNFGRNPKINKMQGTKRRSRNIFHRRDSSFGYEFHRSHPHNVSKIYIICRGDWDYFQLLRFQLSSVKSSP
ncbi:uncharacterized protein PADG_04512 [Paracoccidioides brasiliensis Pb18]|uniref:Uncharacterized protein n=1 Tax=Paracoccidioides brasiliensis (strain Pb18) TaxID=502780 RepID=C1GBZ0_PARBD|nr:uncharacterized protein PADG_04512 [Paracoccidioides brasiliensis Pb18]EEH48433.2 hypothetical protein PADG_04512 [Paracoccidioides brasiliensis Pb18]